MYFIKNGFFPVNSKQSRKKENNRSASILQFLKKYLRGSCTIKVFACKTLRKASVADNV